MSCTYHLAIYYILISRFVFDILFIWFSGKNSQERLKVGLKRKECLWEYIYIARKKWYLTVDGYLSFHPKWISSDQFLEAFVLVREMLLSA